MPSDTGAPYNLPYPVGTDQPFVHLDMKALAEAVAASLADMVHPHVRIVRDGSVSGGTSNYGASTYFAVPLDAIQAAQTRDPDGVFTWSYADRRLTVARTGLYAITYQSQTNKASTIAGICLGGTGSTFTKLLGNGQSGAALGGHNVSATHLLTAGEKVGVVLYFSATGDDALESANNPHALTVTYLG